jgi:transposase
MYTINYQWTKMRLLPDTKVQLERRARQTRDKHEHTRLCVILARSEGISPELIAQTHRISVSSVYVYLEEYEKENKTQHDSRGGTESKLNREQTRELLLHLQTVTYLYTKDICRYVKAKYGVEYSRSGMNAWLKEQDFEYKEPIKVPGKMDPEKQMQFVEAYEELKGSLPKGEEIYFLDAVHPEFQSQAVCGWIKKGETKTLPTTNTQFRLHFIGAIALKSMTVVAREYKTVNAENMIDFLKDLEKNSSARKIHVICDNGRANKNKAIEEYLKTSKIEMHYLPPYSPNLNPIERLWKMMREKKTYNKCYENLAEFTAAISSFFFEDIPKIGMNLKKRINDNFQLIEINPIRLAVA